MKKSRFTEEQVIRILREAESEDINVKEVCRRHGVSEQSFYRWRSKFGGMEVSDVKKLKSLEDENRRLKKLLAERDLEVEVMKEVIKKVVTGPEKKTVAAYMRGRGLSMPSCARVATLESFDDVLLRQDGIT